MEPLLDFLVGVPLSDLEVVRATLNSAYHHSTVLDLAEQYRRLTARPAPSKLTQSLQSALTLVTDHIEEFKLSQEPPDGRSDQEATD